MKIVAVTACLTGIAHTYLAAESLEKNAKARGIEIKVETQGAIGIENKITLEDIEKEDAVILTNNIEIEEAERFEGKYILKVSVRDLVRKPNEVLQKVEDYVNGEIFF